MQVYKPVFRLVAISHLACAVLLLLTNPRDRWGQYPHLLAQEPQTLAPLGFNQDATKKQKLKVTRLKLATADRQVAAGFVALACVLQGPQPHSHQGTKAVAALLLWDGALLLNYAHAHGTHVLRDWPKLDPVEWFVIAHAFIGTVVAMVYLTHILIQVIAARCLRRVRAACSRTTYPKPPQAMYLIPTPSAPPMPPGWELPT